jgi:hypothetical protein
MEEGQGSVPEGTGSRAPLGTGINKQHGLQVPGQVKRAEAGKRDAGSKATCHAVLDCGAHSEDKGRGGAHRAKNLLGLGQAVTSLAVQVQALL